MHLRLFDIVERDEHSCPSGSGTQWYTCNTSTIRFAGCCSVDPCNLPACPDAGALSNRLSSASLNLPSSSTPTPTPDSVGVIATVTVSATSSPTPVERSSSKSPAAPIIAGVVGGVVALSILSVILWFCCKRRRQKRNVGQSTTKYGIPTREYVLSRAQSPELDVPKSSNVFAEFGGRYRTPSPALNRRATAPTPLPRATTTNSMIIYSPIDGPIPDIEKSGLTPPPVTEHPAFHTGGTSSRTDSPRPPTYHPGQQMHSPPMTSHPAYHVSQLSQHPAFSSPRSATFPQRTPQVKRQKSSPRAGGCAGPTDITPIIPSPPSGRSELEAEVPASYTSPTTQNPSQQDSEICVTTSYNPTDYAQYVTRAGGGGGVRNNTLANAYNTPVGLGVVNSPLSPSQYRGSQRGSLGVITPQSVMSPQSPFHLETQYSHLSYPSLSIPGKKAISMSEVEMREGKEKEAVVVSPMSPERWSGTTCLNSNSEEVEMELRQMKGKGKGKGGGKMNGEQVTFEQVNAGNTPVNESPTGLTPTDDFKTWETWAQR